MSRKILRKRGAIPGAVIAALGMSSSASAAFIPVYGGPTWDQTTQTGFSYTYVDNLPGAPVGNGIAVGWGEKRVNGQVAAHGAPVWDASGAVKELSYLGSANYVSVSGASAINAAGTIVGSSTDFVGDEILGTRAVRWDASGTITELGHIGTDTRGFTFAEAVVVNDAGIAAGDAVKHSGDQYLGRRAVRWDLSGIATELGNLGTDSAGKTDCQIIGMNQAGTVVGYAQKYTPVGVGNLRPVRWDASGTAATELDPLGTNNNGAAMGIAYAINDAGTVVGGVAKWVDGVEFGRRAVRWDASGTAVTELGNLGTNSQGITYAGAWAINNAGTAVGNAYKYDGDTQIGYRAVRWDASATAAIELGSLGGPSAEFVHDDAYGINSQGVAVGFAAKMLSSDIPDRHAVIWSADGSAIDLNNLIDPASGWTLNQPGGITDTNWISGVGTFDPDGDGPLAPYTRGFLLNVSSIVDGSRRMGDLNLDGAVTIADFIQLAAHFGERGTWEEGDLNYDGVVSIADFIALASNFNTSYGGESFPISQGDQQVLAEFANSIPEPGALLIGALGTSALRRPRQRSARRVR